MVLVSSVLTPAQLIPMNNHYYTDLFKNDYVKYYVAKGDSNYVVYILNLLKNKRASDLYNIATYNNDINMVDALIKSKVDFNEHTFRVAMVNTCNDKVILRLLLRNGCHVQSEDRHMAYKVFEVCN